MAIQVNDRVRVISRVTAHTQGRARTRLTFEVGMDYRVHRLFTRSLVLQHTNGRYATISRGAVEELSADAVPAVAANPDRIAVDDPRIAWIWEAAHESATNRGYCSEYDDILDDIGAPPRPREWRVEIRITAKGEDGVYELLKNVPGFHEILGAEIYD